MIAFPNIFPKQSLRRRGSNGFGKAALYPARSRSGNHFEQKNAYLVTLALVSPRRNSRLRAQTSIFTIDNQHFLFQLAPQASWPPEVPAEFLEARSSHPGVLSQGSLARSPQPGVLIQKMSAWSSQPGVFSQRSSASSLQPICLGSALESVVFRNVCSVTFATQQSFSIDSKTPPASLLMSELEVWVKP